MQIQSQSTPTERFYKMEPQFLDDRLLSAEEAFELQQVTAQLPRRSEERMRANELTVLVNAAIQIDLSVQELLIGINEGQPGANLELALRHIVIIVRETSAYPKNYYQAQFTELKCRIQKVSEQIKRANKLLLQIDVLDSTPMAISVGSITAIQQEIDEITTQLEQSTDQTTERLLNRCHNMSQYLLDSYFNRIDTMPKESSEPLFLLDLVV